MGVHGVCSSPLLHTLVVFLLCFSAMDAVSSLHLLDDLGQLVEAFW